jgi:hypothetical protein
MKEENVIVNIKLKILPFGQSLVEFRSSGKEGEKIETQPPVYLGPKTTNPHFVEVSFDGENYSVPETTGGLF